MSCLQQILEENANGLSHIRFIDFIHKSDDFHYRIAVCWTSDSDELRDLLYHQAELIASECGWYPLPQGSRLNSMQKSRRRPRGAALNILPTLSGEMRSVQAAVKPEDGCSVRVSLSSGDSILLDSGLPSRLNVESTDKLLLLSHSHADHSGGLTTGRCHGLPVMMSPTTCEILNSYGHLSIDQVQSTTVLFNSGEQHRLGESLYVEAFAVPHLPGSVGWTISDRQTSLIFTGDICLRTARHSFIEPLAERCAASPERRVTVLLDATMAGRIAGATDVQAAKKVVNLGDDEIVVSADSGEHLLYAYLDLFHEVQKSKNRHTVSFIVSGTTRKFFEMLHSAFIGRRRDELDPFILGQYGSAMSSWGESRWLFWADRMIRIPHGRRIWFLTKQEVERGIGPEFAKVMSIGRDDVSHLAGHRPNWKSVDDVDTTPWTLHSNEATIKEACLALEGVGAKVVLFHNFSSRIKKFIRDSEVHAIPLSGSITL